MDNVESVSREIVNRLAIFIKSNMPELCEVIQDWPDPNMALKYPSMSIFTGKPDHTPMMPYQFSSVDLTGPQKKITTKWVVGQYEWNLQLDMWCSSKAQRNVLWEKFYRAFNAQFISDESDAMGISLSLEDYHNTIARYELISYNFDDDEATTQRKEWRNKIGVLAHCFAVLDREQFKIEKPEIHSDIRTDVKVEPGESGQEEVLLISEQEGA